MITQIYDTELMLMVEEIRGLSFRVDESALRLGATARRIGDLLASVHELTGLRTVFEHDTAELSETIGKMKAFLQK